MSISYILLGSNLGNKLAHLEKAIFFLKRAGINLLEISHLYQTKAWGNENQDDFYNLVLKAETNLNPVDLLETLLNIESKMGRVRSEEKWLPRIIDLDILYYNSQVIDLPELKIPHPYIAKRKFTLIPLNDIAADYIHPILGLTNKELLQNCLDQGEVIETNLSLDIEN
jgi:2-amino-4-hydroxy-6-hydroxymethyldihydropteridine diphosphokinase